MLGKYKSTKEGGGYLKMLLEIPCYKTFKDVRTKKAVKKYFYDFIETSINDALYKNQLINLNSKIRMIEYLDISIGEELVVVIIKGITKKQFDDFIDDEFLKTAYEEMKELGYVI